MRFALLGNHPDGLEMACALVESGRHQLMAYTTSISEDILRRWDGAARQVRDLEEVLADPAIEALIVAGSPTVRPVQLRRALQSERHVLCVCPPDQTPEIAYEAALIQKDTGCVLLPLLPEGLHPAVVRLAGLIQRATGEGETSSSLGRFRLLEVKRSASGEILEGVENPAWKASFPGWSILRTLGGEISEISAFAEQDELLPSAPVLVAGRFEQGGVFQETLLPGQPHPCWRLIVTGSNSRAELFFPLGWEGPAFLTWRDQGEEHEESWERWDPWPALIERFEAALQEQRPPQPPPSEPLREMVNEVVGLFSADTPSAGLVRPPLHWQDAVRAVELDDAARRSVERRRASLLEYPEANEEVGFKGTMTLVGCGLLWVILVLLILSRWVPLLGWLIVPLLVLFLGLQFLRYLIPSRGPERGSPQRTE